MSGCREGNHLTASLADSTQVAPCAERLLDRQALGQIRRMTAGCQLPPQPGGSVFDLTMEGRSILHERRSVPPDLFGRAPAECTPTPARV